MADRYNALQRIRQQAGAGTSTLGGTNTAGSQPGVQPNIWDTQPKPANALRSVIAGAYPIDARRTSMGSTPAAGGFTEAPPQSAGLTGTSYPGGQGNYMSYGSNAGGLRVDPNYLPETWDYKESPEYQNRLAWAQRDLNRLLLARGRSDSTGGINALARQQSEMAADEIDKQYQRALQANTANYGRYLGANVENYGRTRGEDETGWNRAWNVSERDRLQGNYMGEQDWNRNFQLAGLGYDATRTGVTSGDRTGFALATLLSQNGATQASLALSSGAVSADTIQRLLDAGLGFLDIEGIFGGGASTGGIGSGIPTGYNATGATAPGLPAPSGSVGGFMPPPQLASLPTGQVPQWMMQRSNFDSIFSG